MQIELFHNKSNQHQNELNFHKLLGAIPPRDWPGILSLGLRGLLTPKVPGSILLANNPWAHLTSLQRISVRKMTWEGL